VYDIQAMLVMQKNAPPAAAHRETRRKDDKLPEPLIAVIDDDEPFRTALIESLCSFGYTARGFESAEHFIATDEQAPCDCIVTDIHMPGMSGLDLKRLLIDRGSLTPVTGDIGRSDRSTPKAIQIGRPDQLSGKGVEGLIASSAQ
jgi:DNA-binding NtrC family response regulator